MPKQGTRPQVTPCCQLLADCSVSSCQNCSTICTSQLLSLQSRGADPGIRTENYDPYLSPGLKLPMDVALEDSEIRRKLKDLDKKYAKVLIAS